MSAGAVDTAAVVGIDNEDHELGVENPVKNPVVADSDPVDLSIPGQAYHAGWSGFVPQRVDPLADARPVAGVQGRKLLDYRPMQTNLIGHTASPS
jgi:hypothetical protein